jgi:hypothetical protein
MGKIKFDKQGKLVSFDKRYLKKHHEKGYYMISGPLIHYFDNKKKYEKSKILVK